ncbi:MAG: PD-(D/E)XK nuclease family protein, partial [Clostridia bacterium]|nr:PD-(D/E)XK nuclease family protein [Clostridia bacterium]
RLAPGNRYRIWEEQFLIYQALTRPSHYLYLSYPLADQEGQSLYPSSLIRRLKELFPLLQEKLIRDEPQGNPAEQMAYLTSPRRCLGYLGTKLKDLEKGVKPEPFWQEVYLWLKKSDRWQEFLKHLEIGIFFTNQIPDLKPALSKACYGRRLHSSITRLEKYGACPFSYFLNYTLKLQERPIYRFQAPEIGSLFHRVLQSYLQLLPKDQALWGEMTEAEIAELLQQIMQNLALNLTDFRQQGLIKRLQRQLLRTALIMQEHFRRGEFWPIALELDFHNFQLNSEVALSGQIDRLDLAKKGNQYFIRVLDYKSGKRDWNQELYTQGIDLQLPLYLKIGQELYQKKLGQKIRPAGMFYLVIDDPLLPISEPLPIPLQEQERLKAHKLRGLVLGDERVIRLMDREIEKTSLLLPVALTNTGFSQSSKILPEAEFQQLLESATQIAGQLGKNILAGKILIQPYRYKKQTACHFCPYHAVCQFDPAFACNSYKQLDQSRRK